MVNGNDCLLFGYGEIKVDIEDFEDFIRSENIWGEEEIEQKLADNTDYVYLYDDDLLYKFLDWVVWPYNNGLTLKTP